MKKIFTRSLCLASLCLTGLTQAQTNSVSLKDGAGTMISSHASISDAYSAIPATLTQAYIIELTNAYNGATETYPVTFINKAGASMANSITLRPAAGTTSVIIQANNPGNPVIKLDNADYMIFDGRAGGTGTVSALGFNNIATNSSANTVQLINGSCFNTFMYCIIRNSTTGSAGRNVHLSTSAGNPSGNSDNIFKYCNLVNGRYQFNSGGTAGNPNTRNTIFGCSFRNATFAMYWAQANTGKITIDSCTFACTAPTGDGLYFGILFDSQNDSAIIVNNKLYDIQDLSTGALRYIHVRSVVAGGTNFVDIRNNFFSMLTGNAALNNIGAIEISSGGSQSNARIAHNSFRFGGTLTSGGTSGNVGSSCLLLSSTNAASAFEIKNNLFVNERTGGTAGLQHLAMAVTNTTPAFDISGNTYNSVTAQLTRWGATVNTTIPAHQATVMGGEPTANDFPVQYLGGNNLHIACAAIGNPSLMTTGLPAITTDIDGDVRGSMTYRGADEASFVAPVISLSGQDNITCNGLSNGSASVTVTGSGSFTYSWSPAGGSSDMASGLAAGDYTVVATDVSGCTATQTLTITEPAAITSSVGTVNNVSCNGSNDGSAGISASGGTGSLSYSWAPSGITTSTASGLDAGNYTVTITDANNCTTSSTLTVTEPAAIDSTVTQNALTITANAAGATYQWINCGTGTPVSGETAQSFTASANGNYAVEITIAGCTKTSSCVTISSVGMKETGIVRGLQIYPNPGTGLYTIRVSENAEVTISNIIGEIIFKQTIAKGDSILDIEKYPDGIYNVNVIAEDRSSVIKLIKH